MVEQICKVILSLLVILILAQFWSFCIKIRYDKYVDFTLVLLDITFQSKFTQIRFSAKIIGCEFSSLVSACCVQSCL